MKASAASASNGGGSGGEGGGDGGKTAFFHGKINKEKADELLSADGGNDISGKFLIRAKKDEGKYLLSVVYKGSPSHHSIDTDEGGKLLINKTPTGASTLADLVEHLRTKRPKWPVPLTQGVPGPGGGGAVAATGVAAVTTGPVVESDTEFQYFHGKINKEKAEAKLSGGSDGKFLFRAKPKEGEYILSVVYKGKPTHHPVSNAESSTFTLNKQPTPCRTLQDLAKWLESKRQKWPVALTEGVTRKGYVAAAPTIPIAAPAAAPTATTTPPSSDAVQERRTSVVSEVNTVRLGLMLIESRFKKNPPKKVAFQSVLALFWTRR